MDYPDILFALEFYIYKKTKTNESEKGKIFKLKI